MKILRKIFVYFIFSFDNDDYFEVFLAQSVPNFNFVRHQQQVSCQQISHFFYKYGVGIYIFVEFFTLITIEQKLTLYFSKILKALRKPHSAQLHSDVVAVKLVSNKLMLRAAYIRLQT